VLKLEFLFAFTWKTLMFSSSSTNHALK